MKRLAFAGVVVSLALANSASAITRYLGLFVADTNGGTVFTGADNATMTFTLVVP